MNAARWVSLAVLAVACKEPASTKAGPAASASARGPGPGDVLLFDGAVEAPAPITLDAATKAHVLGIVFPQGYRHEEAECFSTDATLDAARAAGDLLPEIFDRVSGAFTAPGAAETLYVILDHECGAKRSQNGGMTTLAVVADDKLVASSVFDSALSVKARALDLDADGKNEALVTWRWSFDGDHGARVRVLLFGPKKVSTLADFGRVLADTCSAPRLTFGLRSYSVVWATPGKPPRYTTDKREERCPKKK